MDAGWTSERISVAAKLWREGMTARQIADRLRISRNAVVGIAHRNRDLFPGKRAIASSGSRKVRLAKAPKPAGMEAASRAPRPQKFSTRGPWETQLPVAQAPAGKKYDLDGYRIPGVEPVAFIDLNRHQCRFPLASFDAASGPQMPCCGAEVVEGRSYCTVHFAVTTGRVA